MRQLGKVKTTLRARPVASPSPGRGEGEGFAQRNGSVQPKPLTSVLSLSTRGEAESLDRVRREFRNSDCHAARACCDSERML